VAPKAIDEDTARRALELYVVQGLALAAAAALTERPEDERKRLAEELSAQRFETSVDEQGNVWLTVAGERLVECHLRDLEPGLLYGLH
jgi:hypothetical protein